jgi:hypothetical protein
MKIRSLIAVSIVVILIGGAFFYFSSGADNSLSVIVGKGLDKELIEIEYGFYSISEDSDRDLVKNGLKKVVYKEGESSEFETICGENDFLVTYGSKYYTIVRHFIPNNFIDGIPDGHDYKFILTKSELGVILSLEIDGTDGRTFIREMSKIKEAATNSWGAPKDIE